jgi:signal transduction histidine kinase
MSRVGDAAKNEGPRCLITALCELAAQVQRQRTTDRVLATAGSGLAELGMRMVVFQLCGDDLLLRYLSTSAGRQQALERELRRPLRGLTAPLLGRSDIVREVTGQRASVYRADLNIFAEFLRAAVGYDAAPLEATPATAGICNGLLAPLFVQERPWGVLEVLSDSLTASDASAVSLFALQVACALEVAESIEALESTNRDLTQAQHELVKRERLAALGELAAVMAHEVRNPLGVLFNSISSLRRVIHTALERGELEQAEALLTIASEEAERLDRIVSDLLDFANPHPPRFEPASLPALIEEVSVATRGHRDVGAVAVRTEVEEGLPAVEMDPRKLRQALFNVVMNALQAMPGQGLLLLRARLDDEAGVTWARVDVSDTGPGISAAVRERIFEPFFTTKAFGTGLGLAVVKRIIDLHGGQVMVSAQPQGAMLTLRLPLSQKSARFEPRHDRLRSPEVVKLAAPGSAG